MSGLFSFAAELARKQAMAVLLEREAQQFRRDMCEPLPYYEFPEPQVDWRAVVAELNEGRG